MLRGALVRVLLSAAVAVSGLVGTSGMASGGASASTAAPSAGLRASIPATLATTTPIGGSFADVASGAQFFTEIQWLANQEISTGWTQPDGTREYRPLLPVARDAMAAFMYRLDGSPEFTPPPVSPFTDITPSTQFYKEITWLATQSISTGWTEPDGTKTYRPLQTVGRDAMAAFMYRLDASPAYTAPSSSPFTDITPSTQFYKEITWLAAQNISTGWTEADGTKTYRPLNSVNRDAMAAFMYRFYRLTHPLTVTDGTFHDGMAGTRYLEQLTVTGGITPVTWTATGLPAGITLTSDGALSGIPTATGTTPASFTVTDAAGSTVTVTRTITVPTSMPAGCIGQACAKLIPSSRTVQVPAGLITALTRDPATGKLTTATLTGPSVDGVALAPAQVLVLAPTTGLDSGAIAYVNALTSNADGTVTAAVTPTTPADAYPEATVNAIDPTMPTSGVTAAPAALLSAPATGTARTALYEKKPATPMAVPAAKITAVCDAGVQISLSGASLTADMTPSMAAIWKHPIVQIGNVYLGPGGLNLFQFDLDGSISLNLGAGLSGAGKCTLSLPEFRTMVPAGQLGAVVFAGHPTFTLTASGKAEVSGSVTLKCGAEYRWYNGAQDTIRYCKPETTPFGLSSDNGAKVSATGAIDARVALDDTVGIPGQLNATAVANYTPNQHPAFAVNASSGWELGACLACFWSDSPAHVTIATGTFFNKELFRRDTPPPAPGTSGTGGPLAITSGTLPTATVGNAYRAYLTATGGTGPYTWTITNGTLPPGLHLEPATGAITGTPTIPGTTNLTTTATDNNGATAALTTILTTQPAAPPPPSGLTGVKAMASGDAAGYALKNDGTVWAWGVNDYGQLGNGTTTDSSIPVQVSGLTGAKSISKSGMTVYALMQDGTVRAWGYNGYGQLGNGNTSSGYSSVPVQVSGLTGVKSLTTGHENVFALMQDGTVRAWGSNLGGVLGDGTTATDRSVPIQVSGLTGAVSLAIGNTTAYALMSDGTVRAWGSNGDGQLGNGTTVNNSNVPVQVTGITGAKSVSASVQGAAYALMPDGTVRAWGYNRAGQLGNGTTTASNVPVEVTGITGAVSLAALYGSVYALMPDGTVRAWGANDHGQLGNGTTNNYSSVPVQVTGLTSTTALTAAYDTYGVVDVVYALMSDGTVRAWGSNGYGQLGNGTTIDSSTPVQVTGLTGAQSLSTAESGSVYALMSDGTVRAWGNNRYGQLGNGTTTSTNTPVQVGVKAGP